MAEIGFYHLRSMPLERALPSILERGVAAGHRIVVIAGSSERVEHLNDLLWTYSDASFLPHGSARDGNAERQPIWLTAGDENPNAATMVVLVDGASSAGLAGYQRCCDIFDGNDASAVEAARQRWKAAKEAGHQLVYWEQSDGKWERRSTG
ncbi:MAG TPA: DNA polymerase III subunit chi [Stellaceae bacterium]|jgi:DNA polymerase-3 subunit chi|nr:DNA polymerase III subunit chi [Stellaceae bacterium]